MTPLTDTLSGINSTSNPSVVFQASSTGGAPGTKTYLWSVAPGSDTPVIFDNPLTSSSQRVRLSGVSAGLNKTALFRCVIKDPLNNAATSPTASFQYTNITGP